MELLVASLLCFIVTFGVVAYSIARCQRTVDLQQSTLLQRLDELQSLVSATRQELEWLKTRVRATSSDTDRCLASDTLEQIEQLADAVSLANSAALDDAAKQFASLPAGVASDLFEADQKLLAIIGLIDRGHPLPEISRRLNIPIGEIELLTSMRS